MNLGFPCQLIPQCFTLICHLRLVQYAYLMQQYQRLTQPLLKFKHYVKKREFCGTSVYLLVSVCKI